MKKYTITLEDGTKVVISKESYEAFEKGVQKNDKNWRAEDGGKYWHLNRYDDIDWGIDHRHGISDDRYSSLNYFKTEEEAQAHQHRLLAIGKVTRAIWELNGDWEAGLDDQKAKYEIRYSFIYSEFRFTCYYKEEVKTILPILKSSEIADKIIKDYDKELKIIWGIE